MVNRNEGKEWRALKARATIKKNRRIDATRTFLARAHAGIYAEGYIPVLLSSLLHLRVSASFRCYFAFESLLPFFGSGTITRMRGSLSLSLVATPFRTLPASSAAIMDRSRKSEFNSPSWPDTSNGFNKWRNRVHARIKLEDIIIRSNFD